jgi:uncharacterized membrane protein YfcA
VIRVIISAIILAVLGVLFVVYNNHDGKMMAFGWFLVAVGAIVAAVFTYLWSRQKLTEPEPEPGPKGRRRRRK